MRLVGKFLRYFLNINTIWGWMILIALAFGAYQHYTPTVTRLPAGALREGENALTIRLTPRGGEMREYSYVLTGMNSGEAETSESSKADSDEGAETGTAALTRASGLEIAQTDRKTGGERPWLISAVATADGYALTWDTDAYGHYAVLANGTAVGAGRLVTLQALTDAAFDYAKIGFDIALGLVASMVLFLGLMRVGEAAGLVQLFARAFYPVIRFLFPEVPKDHPASGAILMNWTTTLLGLGNAATPFGLKAMQELQKLNPYKHVASNAQVMLLGYNTAGLALLPTTLLAVRKAAGCSNPFEIIGTCFIAGLVATATAIVMVKVLGMLPMFSARAAAEEEEREAATVGTSANGEDA